MDITGRARTAAVTAILGAAALGGCSEGSEPEAAPPPATTAGASASPSPSPTVAPTRTMPTSYGSATEYAQAVADAAARRDKQQLAEPGSVSAEHWRLIVTSIAGGRPVVTCDDGGADNFDCGVALAPATTDSLYYYVSRSRGHWRVDYASPVVD